MTMRDREAKPLDRATAVPLWRQLQDDLGRRIERGEFSDKFPSELDLADGYAVSRHTVRQALGRLRREGIIRSSRGRESVLAPEVIAPDVGAMYSLFHELESRGIVQRSEVRVVDRRANSRVADRLERVDNSDLVYIERLRYAGDTPIAWDCVWLDPDLAGALLEVDLSHVALYDEWHRVAGIRVTGGRETIHAVLPHQFQRELLQLEPNEGALLVKRIGLVGERAVEYRRTLVRGSRFILTAHWSTTHSYHVDVHGQP